MKNDRHGAEALRNATARQREAQQSAKCIAVEISGRLHALATYLPDCGEEYFEVELAPRIEDWKKRLDKLSI